MDILVLILWALAAYLLIGILFSVLFIIRGIGTIDPAAKGSTIGFKLIVIPGLVALWPIFARRWIGGLSEPPEESNAHRLMARKESN